MEGSVAETAVDTVPGKDTLSVPTQAGPVDVRSMTGNAFSSRPVSFAIKRLLDIVGASVILVLAAPVLVVFALAVKVSSPGPVLYRSRRVGLGGRHFDCFKFRTMREGAETQQATLEELNQAAFPIFKIENDPRVTRVGRWLRTSCMDELPQLLNVVRGEMSLVGPRPLPLRDHALIEGAARRRTEVVPGITGLWQISPARHTTPNLLATLDLEYIERWTLWLDLKIVCLTVGYVMRHLVRRRPEVSTGS